MGHEGSSGESLDYVHHFSEDVLLLGLVLTVSFAENYDRLTQIFEIIGLSPPHALLVLSETPWLPPGQLLQTTSCPPVPLDVARLLS